MSVNAVNLVCEMLNEDAFFFSQHKLIYRAMYACYKHDIPVEPIIVLEELKKQSTHEAAGGIGYLITCSQFAGTSANIEQYCQIILQKAMARKMMALALDIHGKAREDKEDIETVLETAQKGFFDIGRNTGAKTSKHIREILAGDEKEGRQGYMAMVEERQAYFIEHGKPIELPGVPTGFAGVDALIQNMGNSNLIILAARPAMGKTAFALNIAENAAFKFGKTVGIFSLEMSADQLVGRIMSSQAEVNSNMIAKGMISGDQYQRLNEAAHLLAQHNILIDDQSGISIKDIRVRARRWKETHDVDLLIIDYLGLVEDSGSKIAKENQVQKIAEITRILKVMARELDIPLLCLCQLNRKSEERTATGHRPIMSDLRDSGAIEQDADVVMFLHRPEYYNPNDKPGKAECIIAKNRHGGIGSVDMRFAKDFAQFSDLPPLEQLRREAGLAYKDDEE